LLIVGGALVCGQLASSGGALGGWCERVEGSCTGPTCAGRAHRPAPAAPAAAGYTHTGGRALWLAGRPVRPSTRHKCAASPAARARRSRSRPQAPAGHASQRAAGELELGRARARSRNAPGGQMMGAAARRAQPVKVAPGGGRAGGAGQAARAGAGGPARGRQLFAPAPARPPARLNKSARRARPSISAPDPGRRCPSVRRARFLPSCCASN